MSGISKKHWIAFLILFLYNVITLVFSLVRNSYIVGYTISILNILLCLWLIHSYLREPLVEYGLHLKKYIYR